MALQRGKLADPSQLGSSAAAVITNAASQKCYIRGITLFNTSSSTPQTVKLYMVPDSSGSVGTAADANQFFEQVLPAKDSFFLKFPYPVVLTDTNDTLQGSASNASTVTIIVHGDRDA